MSLHLCFKCLPPTAIVVVIIIITIKIIIISIIMLTLLASTRSLTHIQRQTQLYTLRFCSYLHKEDILIQYTNWKDSQFQNDGASLMPDKKRSYKHFPSGTRG